MDLFVDGCGFPVNGVSYGGAPRSHTALYITAKVANLLAGLYEVENCVVFVQTGMEIPKPLQAKHFFVFSDLPQLAYARLADEFSQQREQRERGLRYEFRQPGYSISETARIGDDAYIEPGVVIGHDVVIGDRARILAGAIIKHAIIGDDFTCNEGAVVGTYSFTMADDEAGNKYRIPALGLVRIGDHVEIGANNNVACGSCSDTVLEDYVKLDALVHVGHDVHLCKDVEITAGATIAGFVTVGEHAYFGVNSCFRNRISIGENAIIGMGSTVTKSVDAGVTVAGNPARLFVRRCGK